jgi:hypothetical protein
MKSGYLTNEFVVLRYKSGAWNYLSSTGLGAADPAHIQIATSPAGELYAVTGEDVGGTMKISVHRYNEQSSSWVSVGPQYVSDGEYGNYSLAFTSSGRPVVALAKAGVLNVFSLVGGIWVKMGTAGMIQGSTISLFVAANDVAYVSSGNNSVVVYKIGFDP